MPIRKADTTTLEQVCAGCGAVHTIPLGHAFLKARKGPYAIAAGDTLELEIDGRRSTLTFDVPARVAGGPMPAAMIAEGARGQLARATVDLDGDALHITSLSRGMGISSLRVTGGTAMETLGVDDRLHIPVCLGVTKGAGPYKQTAVDTIELPRCPECGARECLLRTWDACPPGYEKTFFAQHRRVVNALAEYLKAEGFSDPEARALHEAERTRPPDIAADFTHAPMILSFARADNAEGTSS